MKDAEEGLKDAPAQTVGVRKRALFLSFPNGALKDMKTIRKQNDDRERRLASCLSLSGSRYTFSVAQLPCMYSMLPVLSWESETDYGTICCSLISLLNVLLKSLHNLIC